MSGYFVLVRYFLGYSDSFPYKELLPLDDSQISSGLGTLVKKLKRRKEALPFIGAILGEIAFFG